jgi:hypothetical protein
LDGVFGRYHGAVEGKDDSRNKHGLRQADQQRYSGHGASKSVQDNKLRPGQIQGVGSARFFWATLTCFF